MSFYVVYNPDRGNCLLEISPEIPVAASPLVVKECAGHLPDLTRVEWNTATLAFDVKPLRRLSKLDFIGRFGGSYANVLQAAKVSVEVEMFVRMLDWATPDPVDATAIDLDDPRVAYALGQMEAGGILPAGTADTVLA